MTKEREPDCSSCRACAAHYAPEPPADFSAEWLMSTINRMIVCAKCGNKRCPHATDHRLECTDSNEPNQPGSSYQYRYID